MTDFRLGIDIDGVLADFNAAYRRKLIQASGRDLIPDPFEPPCWDYAGHYGYTPDEDQKAWKLIREDGLFWQYLQPLPGAATFLDWAWRLHQDNWTHGRSHEVYFLTTRPGLQAKRQSENWLARYGMNSTPATVLIARGNKGELAKALGLTHFVDDRPENVYDVLDVHFGCQTYMRRAKYNEIEQDAVVRKGGKLVESITEFMHELEKQRV